VANFALAVNGSVHDKAGRFSQRVEWVRWIARNKPAEIAGSLITRNKLVIVEGRLQTRQYQDREGTEHTVCEVMVTTLRTLSRGKNDGRGHSNQEAPPEAAAEDRAGDIPLPGFSRRTATNPKSSSVESINSGKSLSRNRVITGLSGIKTSLYHRRVTGGGFSP
jgi:single stranded DNA-binding protein